MTEPKPRHFAAAHAVVEELQRDKYVQLTQSAGKDIIAQALAESEARLWGYLRELARQVQRAIPLQLRRSESDAAQVSDDPEQRALLLMADDVLTDRLERIGWRSTSTVAAVAPPSTPWTPEPGVEVRVEGSDYGHLNGLFGKVIERHFHPNPNLWEIDLGESGRWNLDAKHLAAVASPAHAEKDPGLILNAVRAAVADHVSTARSSHLRDAVSGLADLVEQLLKKRRECP